MKLYPRKLTVQISLKQFASLQKRAFDEKITIGEVVRGAIEFDETVHGQMIRYEQAKKHRDEKAKQQNK